MKALSCDLAAIQFPAPESMNIILRSYFMTMKGVNR